MTSELPSQAGSGGFAVVWGNCQAAPAAELIAAPLAAAGVTVVRTPPVFEIDEAGLHTLRTDVLPRASVFVSQPIRDEYEVAGCGTRQLAALLPAGARFITFPVVYDSSSFPFQVRGYRGDGSRIAAPLTDYHDLRAIVAAEKGLDVAQALTWWPTVTTEMVLAQAAESTAELHRREQALDICVTDLLHSTEPPLHTLSHPTNATLAAIAGRVLAALDLPDSDVRVPTREFLGAIRTPLEPAVAPALGYAPGSGRTEWLIDKQTVPLARLLAVQLDFYAAHPDVVADTRVRFADRLALLDL